MDHDDDAELWLPSLHHKLLLPLDTLDKLLLLLLAVLAANELQMSLAALDLDYNMVFTLLLTATSSLMLEELTMSCPSLCTEATTSFTLCSAKLLIYGELPQLLLRRHDELPAMLTDQEPPQPLHSGHEIGRAHV